MLSNFKGKLAIHRTIASFLLSFGLFRHPRSSRAQLCASWHNRIPDLSRRAPSIIDLVSSEILYSIIHNAQQKVPTVEIRPFKKLAKKAS